METGVVTGRGTAGNTLPRMVRKNFNFPRPIDEQLKAAAANEYRSEVQIVLKALEFYFREQRRQRLEDKLQAAQL